MGLSKNLFALTLQSLKHCSPEIQTAELNRLLDREPYRAAITKALFPNITSKELEEELATKGSIKIVKGNMCFIGQVANSAEGNTIQWRCVLL